AWHFYYALLLCGGFGIACLTP
ncbi:DUF3265 domain-containing protein, partial [Vibrio parahaemolyticus]|nr:DUF3265 domain-containing protein [Vibrio parahaemolyticus]MDF4259683.1 DUF3265 domain-containing protein [Vibrio parahaemolyticus]MDF4264820.1 DUF3265 domain-containing protein [Vibrio parahaemolyticus]MDF4264873.1 DUF3265 domain-containing protein [Vibrio parahaemolyticus]MDF4326750.1 DUF3265 domain-containing protein [Vibrio parahaemolyticus]